MSFNYKSTPISQRELAEVSSIIFVKMAQEGNLDNVTISEHPSLFPSWDSNWTGKEGTIVEHRGNLYKSIHDITDIAQNTPPADTPSMWTLIADPTVEFPDWVQPIGSHDAYSKGAKVSHNGINYISAVDGNVWEPGVYGWEVSS